MDGSLSPDRYWNFKVGVLVDVDDRIVVKGAVLQLEQYIYYDPDGSGPLAEKLIATVRGTDIAATDFKII